MLCYKWPKIFFFISQLNPYLSEAWIHKAKKATSSLYFSLNLCEWADLHIKKWLQNLLGNVPSQLVFYF